MQHILIDFENIQPNNFDLIKTPEDCHIWLFLGVHQQKSLPYELVKSLFKFQSKCIHLIDMQHTGKNALDHYLAFYLGKISEMDKEAQVFILARDSGYDVLVEHLNKTYNSLKVSRLANVQSFLTYANTTGIQLAEITDVEIKENTNLKSGLEVDESIANALRDTVEYRVTPRFIHNCYLIVLKQIMNKDAYLPKNLKNLKSAIEKYAINNQIKGLSENDVTHLIDEILEKLQKNKLIEVNNNYVTYKISIEDLLNSMTASLLRNKPKDIASLRIRIKEKLEHFNQKSDEEEVSLIIKWLKKENYLKQKNHEIIFIPEDNLKEGVFSQAKDFIIETPQLVRPKSLIALQNWLKSRLKLVEFNEVEQVTKQLQDCNQLSVNADGKISYNL